MINKLCKYQSQVFEFPAFANRENCFIVYIITFGRLKQKRSYQNAEYNQ